MTAENTRTADRPKIVLGTHNAKKRRELELLLGPLGFQLATLAEYDGALEVEETGTTFAENARLKATQQAVHLGEWVLGEDSGLSVDALQGAPGVYSARYAGEDATDADNNQKLMAALKDVPFAECGAHYTCYMVLSDPQGQVQVEAEGHCYGRIRTVESGSGGFGYDPLFEIPEYERTFAELGDEVKSSISHRARAVGQFVPRLLACFTAGTNE